jgi:uncharacterized peroxidase-related enzyme
LADALQEDYRKAPIGPEMMEMLSFAENVTRDASRVAAEDIARLRSAGFSDRAILDAAHIAGFFCYMNRVVQALGADTRSSVSATAKEAVPHGLAAGEVLPT